MDQKRTKSVYRDYFDKIRDVNEEMYTRTLRCGHRDRPIPMAVAIHTRGYPGPAEGGLAVG